MSIVPVSDQGADIDIWDPESFFGSSLDHLMMEHPSSSLFHGFLFPFPSIFFPSHETQVIRWQQTPRAHVVRGVFPAAAAGGGGGGEGGSSPSENVLVYIDDDNMLQISTEDGKFMSSFKLPDDARRDQVKASMVNGVLTVVIPKEGAAAAAAGYRPNVRPIQITGSD